MRKMDSMVYILHFDKPFGHARHYVGYCKDARFNDRMEEHKQGRSGFMKRVHDAGIAWQVVATFPGATENFERRIKTVWKNTTRICPICSGGHEVGKKVRISDLDMWEAYWKKKTGEGLRVFRLKGFGL